MHIPVPNVDTLTENWWAVALRGVAGVLFGIFALIAPGLSLAALVLAFGAFALVDGVFAIVAAARRRGVSDRWWMLLLEGVASVVIGGVTLLLPGITALALLLLIAARALVSGVLQIVAAVRLRKVISGEWLLVLGGTASLAWGVLLVVFPGAGALALVLWIGAFALVTGALLIALAFRLRAWRRSGAAKAAV